MNSPSTFLTQSLLVVIGGGIGAWLRFVAGRLTAPSAFPWATLLVNVSGSFAMGLLVGWLARYGDGGENWRLLLGVGMLGGFTTFSAFSLELVSLIERGQAGLALGYALISVAAGIAGLFLGLFVMRGLV
jgi:fluoride exporter